MNPAGIALCRAEWQDLLFGTPNRADLAACVPQWRLEALRIRVHRNHGFEAVSSATRAFAAWNGLAFEWRIGGYDDSLSFDLREETDVELVWLDTARLHRTPDGIGTWLAERLRALRAQTAAPIIVLAWPLSASDRDRLDDAAVPATYVADLAPLADALGDRWLDLRAESISGTRLGNHACLRIARELACRWLPGVTLPPRKAIAVDLDGTLFQGVLAEDGAAQVVLDSGHRALQERLAELRETGMLLTLISRNDPADVDALFRSRTDFPLRSTDFSALEISWDDKTSALARVAAALRIGEDSIVFVDDNPGELATAASALPVFTVHAKADGHATVAALDHVAGVFRWRRTREDRLRADDLLAIRARSAAAQSAASPEEYLESLDVRLDYFIGPRQHLARIAELSVKTNQFNLSLSRMNEAEIAKRLDDNPSNVVAIRLADRLSDSGLVAALVGSRQGDTLCVEEICVSCRALGRRIEDVMLTKGILVMAGDPAPERVVFAWRNGPRNGPARAWLAQYASATLCDETGAVEMRFDAIAGKPIPPAIRTEVVA